MELDFPIESANPESTSNARWPLWDAPDGNSTSDWSDEAEIESRATLSRVAPKIIRFPSQPFSPIAVTEQQVEPEPGDLAQILEAEPQTADTNPQPAYEEPFAPVPQAPAPQQMELPCFDDIHLESNVAPSPEILEPVPQAAPLGRRAVAGAIDLGVVLLASLTFKLAFTYLAEHEPQTKAALLCAIIVTGALWMLYQYLFLVHGKRTLGMVFTDLELSTFGGNRVGTTGRRLRALATAVSAFSLGLGFAWALLDEDQLGWHDRMTGTVVREANSNLMASDQVKY
jgi:uncharacterized RDD family membrane protein YckC